MSTELRAYRIAGKYPGATARTDRKGRFEFTTLSEGEFRIAVDGAYFPKGGPVINPIESTNDLLLEVTLANGSDVTLGER